MSITSTHTMSRTQRLLSIGAVAAIATVGPVVFSATAHAADANSKVWVCKYVRTPGGDEVLKARQEPDRGQRPLRRQGQGRPDLRR